MIAGAARDHLRPLGLTQKGRVWLDDHRWFVIAVEIQPSGFSRDAHLNVGVMWLWDERGRVAFDVGHRVQPEGFQDYRSDEQFRPHAGRMARQAAARMASYRRTFRTPKDAARYLVRETRVHPDDTFHAACACAPAGNGAGAVRLLRLYAVPDGNDPPWRAARKDDARALAAAGERGVGGLREGVEERIARTRLLLGLGGC